MNVYSTEDEQVAQLKRWLKDFGPAVIIGVILAVAIGFGWRYWQSYTLRTHQAAAVIYTNMMGYELDKNDMQAGLMAKELVKDYHRTPYADFASLLLAKFAVKEKNYKLANQHLNWALNNASNNSIQQIARIRLAKIAIQQNQAQQALTLLQTVNDKTMVGLINSVKGDAYLALKQPGKAKAAFQLAVKSLPANGDPILQMKLENLPSGVK